MNKIENSNKIQDFLKGKTYNTYHNYKSGLKNFLEWFNKQYPKENFDNYIKDIRLLEPKQKLKITDRYEQDIKNWYLQLKDNGFAPKTIATMIASVKSLLINNRIDLDKVFWKNLNYTKPSRSPKFDIIVSTPSEFKEIMQHTTDIRNKAFFLILATSGLRINELCKLKMDDINLKYQCPRITIRDPKNRVKGETRISPETKTAYIEYINKYRKDKIKTSYYRSINLKKAKPLTETELNELIENEKRCFPFSVRTMEGVWNNMLEKSGYNEKDTTGLRDRYKRNVHTLRKYFRSNYGKYDDDLAEYFINHVSELRKTYDTKPKEWLDQEYLNGCKYLSVFSAPMDTSEKIKDMNKKMDEKDKQIQNMQEMMDEMKAQILELRLEKLEKLNGVKNTKK